VLENMPKREVLSEMTNWPTLPKVFINGKFYGDTDILGPMAESGELQKVLHEAFGHAGQPKTTIQLH
jgi:monothiol glutaredoxin